MTLGVVIPVFRGAAVLDRSVGSLMAQEGSPRMHVVIAVNDGEELSVEAARRKAALFESKDIPCDVVVTAPGRAAALNAAEEVLPRGPRLYVDQDAILSGRSVTQLIALLAPRTGVHFAAPALRRGRRNEGWATRHYFDAWQRVPYVAQSPVTAGVYGVSEDGRRRWDLFPPLHSDDKFARLHFAPAERRTAPGCCYEVLLPRSFRELVEARRRYRDGNRQLDGLIRGGARPADLPRHAGLLRVWSSEPRGWLSVSVLLAVHCIAAAPRRRRSGR